MSAVLKATLAATELALDALERGPRRNADPAVDQFRRECERDLPYRGAPALPGGAIDGNEWLRRQELIRAGQRDLFGAE